MTLTQLHQQIGQVKRTAAAIERLLIHHDQIADTCGHPGQARAIMEARTLRFYLSRTFTELHHLEARLPTPELLSERAYNRLLMLGFDAESAEAARLSTYQAAAKPERKAWTKQKGRKPYVRSGLYSKLHVA